MKYIDSEIILQRKVGAVVYIYIMIILVIILSLIIFFILYHYKTYYAVKGTVIEENDHYYIRCYIPLEHLKYVTKNNTVKIDKVEYKYNIIAIDSEYFTDNTTTYQVIKIEISMKDKYKFNNLTLELQFLKDNKRIINYIIK